MDSIREGVEGVIGEKDGCKQVFTAFENGVVCLISSFSNLLAADVNVEYDAGVVPDISTENIVDDKPTFSREVAGADLGEVEELLM